MKNQAIFSSKDKNEKSKCRLLQFLFGALRVKSVCQLEYHIRCLSCNIALLESYKPHRSFSVCLSNCLVFGSTFPGSFFLQFIMANGGINVPCIINGLMISA